MCRLGWCVKWGPETSSQDTITKMENMSSLEFKHLAESHNSGIWLDPLNNARKCVKYFKNGNKVGGGGGGGN